MLHKMVSYHNQKPENSKPIHEEYEKNQEF